MGDDTIGLVSVERRIEAPAQRIFELLADPARHIDIDGSEMLRGADQPTAITGVGDVFFMKMFYGQFGDYVMRNEVTEFVADRRISWTPSRHDIDTDEPWFHRWGFELEPDGSSATTVREFFDCTRSPDDAKEILKNGAVWVEAMTRSLERIDELCATA
jgi:hypothetical protein